MCSSLAQVLPPHFLGRAQAWPPWGEATRPGVVQAAPLGPPAVSNTPSALAKTQGCGMVTARI